MSIDVKTPNTPGWWLSKLAKKREARLPELNRLQSYIEGNPPLPKGVESMRTAYQEIQKTARVNLAEATVTSVSDRISVRSVRTAVANDFDGDEVANQIYRENNLAIEFADVIENMLGLRDGYVMVGLDPDRPDKVVITGEDPRLCVTIHDPVRQSERRAGLKMFHDADAGRDYAYVFIRGEAKRDENDVPTGEFENARVYVASRERKTNAGALRFNPTSWDWDEDHGGVEGKELPHHLVPLVRFRNRNGISEFERQTDTLDRINHGILQRMVISLYQAYRLRALAVDDDDAPDVDPETGKEIDYEDLLSSDPGAFIKIPFGAKLWEGQQADLSGILSAVKDDVLYYMETTKTPMPAISDAVQQSAEGAANIKEGNAFKVERTQHRAEASIALVYELAFLCLGDTARAERGAIRVDFYPSQRPSLAEKYDAFSKSTDLPLETRMAEILQFTPELISMAKSQILEQAMLTEVGAGGSGNAAAAPAAPAQ